MKRPDEMRQLMSAYTLIFYLIPVVGYTLYGSTLISWSQSWHLFLMGLLLAIGGTFFLTTRLWKWQENLSPEEIGRNDELPNVFPSFDEEGEEWEEQSSANHEDVFQLQKAVEELENELRRMHEELENKRTQAENLLHHSQKQEERLLHLETSLQKSERLSAQAKQEIALIQRTSDETVHELQASANKYRQRNAELEKTIDELRYEMKTLLNVQSIESSSSFKTPPVIKLTEKNFQEMTSSDFFKPKEQLKRCIDIAQKLTASSPFELSRFREMGVDSFVLDQRRLFDTLRSETKGIVLLYSKKDQRLLFASSDAKGIFGYSPDKFIHEFESLILEGSDAWKKAVYSLSPVKPMNQVEFTLLSREGSQKRISCELGTIPSGLFKGYIIALLEEVSAASLASQTI